MRRLRIILILLPVLLLLILVVTFGLRRYFPEAPAQPTPSSQTSISQGIFAVIGFNESPTEATWRADIDGVVIRTYWRDVNPQRGTYDWNFLDRQFQKADQFKKKIHLIIAPGFYSPDFVLNDARIEKASFEVPQGPDQGKQRSLPLPWDSVYLSGWFAFVREVAGRYRERDSLAYISATGPNSHNGEVSLPRGVADRQKWLSLVGGEQTLLESKLLSAWSQTFEVFCDQFRNKHYTLAVISRSLPLKEDDRSESSYIEKLAQTGYDQCPGTFGLQTNGLDGRPLDPAGADPLPQWDLVASFAGKALTGFQTRAPGNLYDCPKATAECSSKKIKIFRQVLDNARVAHPDFLEVYESDVLDPSLAPLISQARQDIFGLGGR